MTPIQPIPSLGDKEAVQVVPTWSDVQAALSASHEAFQKYSAEYDAGQDVTESWADYMSAVNHAASIGADHFYATLMEAEIVSVI